MPNTAKALVRTAAATAATFTLTLDSVDIFTTTSIAANSTAMFDLRQVLTTGKIIAGFASAVTVKFHISGMEIS
jgi:hypothetical protein